MPKARAARASPALARTHQLRSVTPPGGEAARPIGTGIDGGAVELVVASS
jgi:hypothetical protein